VRGITSALEDSAGDYELRSRGPAALDHRALDSLLIIATAPQLFIHGLLSFVYIQTAAHISSDLAGPSHTETATVQVEQPADATQPIAGPGTF